MRQAGVVAAAGLEAVVNNYVRLSEVRAGDADLGGAVHCQPRCSFGAVLFVRFSSRRLFQHFETFPQVVGLVRP